MISIQLTTYLILKRANFITSGTKIARLCVTNKTMTKCTF